MLGTLKVPDVTVGGREGAREEEEGEVHTEEKS